MHDKPDPIHAQRSRASRGHRVDRDGRAGGRHRRCRARGLPLHSREAAVAETVDDVLDVLTTQLARVVVEEIVPEELPPFDPISQAFIERRKEDRRKGRKQIDYPSELDWNEDLSFGM